MFLVKLLILILNYMNTYAIPLLQESFKVFDDIKSTKITKYQIHPSLI